MDFSSSPRYTFSLLFVSFLFCTKHRWGDICPCESRNGEAIPYRIRERMPYEKRLLRRAGALLAMTNCHVCPPEYLELVL